MLSSASRSAPACRPLGDGVAGHPLRGGEVGHTARRGGDGHGDGGLRRAVSRWVIWGVVGPALPHDPAPGASEGADRAGVRDRAGGLGRRGPGPRGASGGCCRPGGRTRRADACCMLAGTRRFSIWLTPGRRPLGRRRWRACSDPISSPVARSRPSRPPTAPARSDSSRHARTFPRAAPRRLINAVFATVT